jgi:AraC family transcriptional regulator of adaptative response/methylated-DNA-[protein]-cysteine methyltransferase
MKATREEVDMLTASNEVGAAQSAAYRSDEERWQAVQHRDARADAHFVYAVRTTGIYCRPSSATRLPRRENVVFFDSAEAAEMAGFRASRRSNADRSVTAARRAELVARACHWIDTRDPVPTLAQLASDLGFSPFYFQRLFKAEVGMSPKAYAQACRARRLREQLPGAPTVFRALYDAGFHSPGRLYAESEQLLGMRPGEYRAGGLNADIRFAVGECSLGAILVARSQRGICAIWLDNDPERLVRDLQDRFPQAQLCGDDTEFADWVAKVVGCVESPSLGINLPLDVRGTVFQQRVWRALQQLPPGTTATYADIAERIGMPTAVRAVARACGANQLAMAIPCHRVVRRDGTLSGYRWGVERKRELLHRESLLKS